MALVSSCGIMLFPLIFSCFCEKILLHLVAAQLAAEFPTSATMLLNPVSNYKNFPKP